MLDYWIEIVFDGPFAKMIGDLLCDVTLNGEKILTYNCTCEAKDIHWDNPASIAKIFASNDDFGLFINVTELDRGGFCLPKCLITVYKNKDFFGLELNFKLQDLQNPKLSSLATDLMKLAKSIADQHHLTGYFCGIEPAKDKETRLFTNDQLGPLVFKD
jgi:hypothetical protein